MAVPMPASKADQDLLETGFGGNHGFEPNQEQFDGRFFRFMTAKSPGVK
jgi:hypothetical protein